MNTSYTSFLLRGMLPHSAALLWENIGHSRNVLRPPGPHSIYNAYIQYTVRSTEFVCQVCASVLCCFTHADSTKCLWILQDQGTTSWYERFRSSSSNKLTSIRKFPVSILGLDTQYPDRFSRFSSVSLIGCRECFKRGHYRIFSNSAALYSPKH
jgi:hypothetical protein